MGSQAPLMAGSLGGLAGGDHGVEVNAHLDPAAHEAGVHGVVVGVDAHVVVPRQAGRPAQRRVGTTGGNASIAPRSSPMASRGRTLNLITLPLIEARYRTDRDPGVTLA